MLGRSLKLLTNSLFNTCCLFLELLKSKGEIMQDNQNISDELLQKMDAYWRAANYLSAGQLYLLDNPLLREPLTEEQIKKKIVGHWGTEPGQNFIYTHLNRLIKEYDLDMIYISGPGHGGNFMVANAYLEGTYSEVYPNVSRDIEGMKKLFKQFSFPGGISSHVAPETPGSIHEGGELGYSLAHSFGAVLPILHLNGYKISNPTVFSRISHEELEKFFEGCGWKPYFVEGSDPMPMTMEQPEHMDQLKEWLLSYRPEELFDENGEKTQNRNLIR